MNRSVPFTLVIVVIPEVGGASTCQASSQPDGAGMRSRRAFRRQQLTEDGVGDEVERVARHVPQNHGAGAPVQAREALGLQDAADAVDRPPVQLLAGDGDGVQGDVGAVRHVPGKVQVLCGGGESGRS